MFPQYVVEEPEPGNSISKSERFKAVFPFWKEINSSVPSHIFALQLLKVMELNDKKSEEVQPNPKLL